MLLLLLAFFVGLSAADYVPRVKTPNGVVVGHYKTSYNGRKFVAFEGIPYAKKPVGALRFEEPQSVEPWSGELHANKTYICLQYSPLPMMKGPMGKEDCLYVYVYVPRQEIKEDDKPLDVVIHIHGGAFMVGSPSLMAGPDYIMDKDVVYVSLNYRLGLLGFLSTEDDVVSGNNGLKDQRLALKWIKDNIRYFGGNPDSITITGLSAGSVSVHYHYISQLSKGLFHRGFSQSGTCLQSWGVAEKPLEMAKKLAKEVNCDRASSSDLVACLKQIKDRKLVNAVSKLFIFASTMPFAPFAPVIEKPSDGAFLTENPYKLLKEGRLVNDVPWVASNTADEGLFPVALFTMFRKLGELGKRWEEVAPLVLDFFNTVDDSKKNEVAQRINEFYGIGTEITTKNVTGLAKLFSDRYFFVDAEKAIRLHVKISKSPVYYFRFSYVLKQDGLFGSLPFSGAQHSDDGKILFRILGTPDVLPKGDEQAKNLLIDFIYDYATTGKVKIGGVEVKPLQADGDINFLDINTSLQIEEKTVKELGPNDFWNSLPIMELDRATA